MAGSYHHVVDDQGRLLGPEDLDQVLDTGGDVYEAVREMFGMIWFLADKVMVPGQDIADTVKAASMWHQEGLRLSPGVSD